MNVAILGLFVIGLVVLAVIIGVVVAIALSLRARGGGQVGGTTPGVATEGRGYVEACAICRGAVGDGRPFRRCEGCGVPMHEECAGEAKVCPGCANAG
jgi:hypothetical protein